MALLNGLFAFKSTGQIANELLVDERIDVLAQEEEDEPVADLTFAGDQFHLVAWRKTGLGPQEVHAGLRAQHDSQTVEKG